MSQWFVDRVAIVTGGASGIGLAVASKLLSLGVQLAVVDRDGSALQGAFGGVDKVLKIEADVSDRIQVERYVSTCLDRFGRIDMFHNNAGLLGPRAPLLDFTDEDYHSLFDVNVLGSLLGLQAVAKAMKASSGGSIVNTASAVGLRSVADHGLYGATKATVLRITQQAAAELGQFNIRVNAVAPGSVDTPALRSSLKGTSEDGGEVDRRVSRQLRKRPLGLPITADDVADLVLWLLGPASSKITGSINVIDGGVLT
ncbi:SDR family oxidoreductase [Bradyrhizobium sp. WYCCWR 13022]|uniref:SDR family NAD(P)-dependent oxidoreductase n=1 Tax=unclassified Bradyrhizobium TaxID=2631580 RepID=UPI00263AC0FF|nr:SDR family oxidoreductase [Bradyrhizobium sp. WYCCWR 13022]MDN4984326.1 SDR family oxidoreductase [Bradyrhizobium sp. WYCCWR 13022]